MSTRLTAPHLRRAEFDNVVHALQHIAVRLAMHGENAFHTEQVGWHPIRAVRRASACSASRSISAIDFDTDRGNAVVVLVVVVIVVVHACMLVFVLVISHVLVRMFFFVQAVRLDQNL